MTNSELVVLSLVMEQPRHGYDIEAAIVERNMRQWTAIGFSSIYYVLEKLEANGYATSVREPAPGRGPARRIYSATAEGAAALREQALEAIASPDQQASTLLLGLSTLPLLDAASVTHALGRHEAELEERLTALCAPIAIESGGVADRRPDGEFAETRTGANEAADGGTAGGQVAPPFELPFHVVAMFELSIAQVQAELDWVRRFAEDFEQHRLDQSEAND